ncbi:GAF domain-containing protein [Clostridium sp. 'deep sea']|uniref:GAF domain-containing protein n=1 Tax=Clostridium sp. 'deep sea' TaxID=2779445 RepID=UPI0018968866|nr:GAF domain-containing protein [Clostridium sp. 'deep sea']QOR35975.1 GAF domain-containing protein [Clostridium sp. 'deep sea']
MEQIKKVKTKSKNELYNNINNILKGMIENESDWLASLSNAAALLGMMLNEINWAGLYLYKNSELILGPFWGKPACTHIKIGDGVCGTAANNRKTLIVKNVLEFEDHIACDVDTLSEIVVPIIKDGELKGVLDIDSPILERFNEEDLIGLENFVSLLVKYVDWSAIV